MLSSPTPALVPCSISEDESSIVDGKARPLADRAANRSTTPAPASTDKHSKREGTQAGRGRPGTIWAPPSGRAAKWPKNSDMRAAPDRDEIKWNVDENAFGSSEIDSAVADSGYGGGGKKKKKDATHGVDPDTGFELTDWDGKWAPVSLTRDFRAQCGLSR